MHANTVRALDKLSLVPFVALWLALLSNSWPVSSTAAQELPSLSSCAQRYGQLMTEHWLTVDLAQQVERALSYRPEARVAEPRTQFEKLQVSLAGAEQQLAEARSLYRIAFATNSAEVVAQLARLLDQAADSQSNHEATATALLHSGIHGFYIPMAASNQLEIAEGLRKGTAPVFGWMKTNHTGYHYWAGVYNNQNTYVAPWFLQQQTNDDDIWMKLANRKVLKGGEWSQVNIWNAQVCAYLRNYCETQARTLSGDPFLVCYDYTGEPHPWGSQPPGQPQYSGYNDSAIRAFQDYLRAKFGRIAKLNQSWQADYAGKGSGAHKRTFSPSQGENMRMCAPDPNGA